MRDWNTFGHLIVIPAVLIVIGVMLYSVWQSPNPNQNTWWTEVRKEQQNLEVEPIVSPEYRIINSSQNPDRSVSPAAPDSNRSVSATALDSSRSVSPAAQGSESKFSVANELPTDSKCKAFGGDIDCDLRNELPIENLTSEARGREAKTVELYKLPGQWEQLPVTPSSSWNHRSVKVESDFEQHLKVAEKVVSNQLSIVMDDNWPLARRELDRIERVIEDSANVIYKHLRDEPRIRLVIRFDEEGPVAVYTGRGKSKQPGVYREIWLATNGYEPQVIYQFAHEFGHVIQDYDRFSSKPAYKNAWFHEALCELASIYVLHNLDENGNLRKYVDDHLRPARERLAQIQDFKSWLLETEQHLRHMAPELDRESQAVVAYRLLPLFESYPELWGTLWELPTTSRSLSAYLAQWRRRVDAEDRYLIDRVRKALFST